MVKVEAFAVEQARATHSWETGFIVILPRANAPTGTVIIPRASPHDVSCVVKVIWICHVVALEDTQTDIWEQAGLFTFPYRSTSNAVPLCPSCHVEFDRSIDPGYVFFPSDLKFFIDFELEDRERRETAAANGNPVKRQVPGAIQYRKYQQDKGLVSSDAIGGLYRRVFLKNFLLDGRYPDVLRDCSTPKEWHGNPIASIRRAFAALGSPRIYVLGSEIRKELELLRDLYFADVFQSGSGPLLKRHLEEEEEEEDDAPPAKKATRDRGPQHLTDTLEEKHSSQSVKDAVWALGPNSTSNTAMQLYAPLFPCL
ncbi:hypothetical protein DTO217A2_6889 [Paecilomyces variotii]|nr:hypothetical protein DTO217A2_6889 [Paecilomyces variotii]